jgi:TPR repeat protein
MSTNLVSKILFTGCLSFSNLAFADTLEQAVISLKTGQTEQAIDLFKEQKNNPDAMLNLAKIYMDTNLDEAEDWIEKAVKADINNEYR